MVPGARCFDEDLWISGDHGSTPPGQRVLESLGVTHVVETRGHFEWARGHTLEVIGGRAEGQAGRWAGRRAGRPTR